MIDPDLEGLHGPVRRVTVTQTSRLIRDDGESVDRSARAATLDPAGRVAETSWEYPSGASGRTVHTHDSEGRLVAQVESTTNPDGRVWTFRRTYAYDDRGRLIEERREGADGSIVRTRRPVYAADGRRIENERLAPRGRGTCCGLCTTGVDGVNMDFFTPSRARSTRVVHDARGVPLELTFTGRLGVTVGKVVFESDPNGRITAIRNYGDPGEFHASVSAWLRPIAPIVLWLFRRTMNGWARWNLLRRARWRALARTVWWGPLWFETLTRYDTHGRRVEERRRFAGALETVETWTYDDDGRLVEHRGLDESGGLTTVEAYAFRADARGNWVHRTITRRRLPHSPEEMIDTTERVVDYY